MVDLGHGFYCGLLAVNLLKILYYQKKEVMLYDFLFLLIFMFFHKQFDTNHRAALE